jgi:hypothetical protein
VVARRSGPSYRAGHRAGRPRRGFVTLERPLPRFVEVRRLARGSVAFYFRIPTYYRKLGCEMANEPLGTSYEAACGDDEKAVAPPHSMAYSMSGTASAEESRASRERLRAMAQSIGCSDNTRRRRPIPRKSLQGHALTTSGSYR